MLTDTYHEKSDLEVHRFNISSEAPLRLNTDKSPIIVPIHPKADSTKVHQRIISLIQKRNFEISDAMFAVVDDFGIVQVIMDVEREFNVDIPDPDAIQLTGDLKRLYIPDLSDYVTSKLKNK